MSEYRGRIVALGQTERRGEKFVVRTVVLTDDAPKYPQFVKFEAQQDEVKLLDSVQLGQTVVVTYQLRGREWTNREGRTDYFNTLKLMSIAGTGDRDPNVTSAEKRYEFWT